MSLLKVVATIDSPASHHGTARPEAKNSDVLCPARLPKNSAGHEADEQAGRDDDPVEGCEMHEALATIQETADPRRRGRRWGGFVCGEREIPTFVGGLSD